MATFTGNEGRLISAAEIKDLTAPHHAKENEITAKGDNYIKAEFFGIHTFNRLIGLHGDNCVGFRVYYGNQIEEHVEGEEKPVIGSKKGKPTSRLVIVPVNKEGKDITTGLGLKDMPASEDGMAGGPLCPHKC
jgi:hypothetical protein